MSWFNFQKPVKFTEEELNQNIDEEAYQKKIRKRIDKETEEILKHYEELNEIYKSKPPDFDDRQTGYLKDKYSKSERKPLSVNERKRLIKERGIICEECYKNYFHDIHHLDGNPSNNDFSNLLLVCKDCHWKIEDKTPLREKVNNN